MRRLLFVPYLKCEYVRFPLSNRKKRDIGSFIYVLKEKKDIALIIIIDLLQLQTMFFK